MNRAPINGTPHKQSLKIGVKKKEELKGVVEVVAQKIFEEGHGVVMWRGGSYEVFRIPCIRTTVVDLPSAIGVEHQHRNNSHMASSTCERAWGTYGTLTRSGDDGYKASRWHRNSLRNGNGTGE